MRNRMVGELSVLVLAFALRFSFVLASPGGLRGNYGYDASVYYSAADALSFGRLPYRDFVMLHPPGAMLALIPFAALGRITSDDTGFIAGNIAFMMLGAVNAVLVVRVALRMNFDHRAAIAAGLFYAFWIGSVGAEFLSRLEPLGNFAALCGLLAYFRARDAPSRLSAMMCGVAFGAAASVKIWWVVPLLILLAWHLTTQRRRRLHQVAGGAALSLIVLNGPFFAAAPAQMWHMVIIDQLGRNRNQSSLLIRMSELSGVHQLDAHLGSALTLTFSLVLPATFAYALALAWRVSAARLILVLALAQGTLLMTAPSWFSFYADYLAPAAALSLAAAVSTSPASFADARFSPRPRVIAWTPLIAATAVTCMFLIAGPNWATARFPSERLARAVDHTRCVMSDSPMGLILLNTLSRDLSHGCQNWVDVTGRTYGIDASSGVDGGPGPRSKNPRWQRDLLRYLRSGNAVLLIRTAGTGISHSTLVTLHRAGALAAADGYVIYRTPHD